MTETEEKHTLYKVGVCVHKAPDSSQPRLLDRFFYIVAPSASSAVTTAEARAVIDIINYHNKYRRTVDASEINVEWISCKCIKTGIILDDEYCRTDYMG